MTGFPTCAILAGGLGTRLRDAVPGSPKSVAPVAGHPFLLHLLQQFCEAGARRIVLCTGHRSIEVQAQIGDRLNDAEIVYSTEDRPLGTGGALRLAWERFGDRNSQGWLITNGDSYCAVDLNEFWQEHQASGLAAAMVATEVPDGSRYGSLRWDDDGRLTSFGEKLPGAGAWINAGIYAFSPPFLDALSETTPLSLERESFPAWVQHGIHVFARKAPFIDIGTPDSYRAAQVFFNGIHI